MNFLVRYRDNASMEYDPAVISRHSGSSFNLDRKAGEEGSMTRPPNGDLKGLQKFEADIANIIRAEGFGMLGR